MKNAQLLKDKLFQAGYVDQLHDALKRYLYDLGYTSSLPDALDKYLFDSGYTALTLTEKLDDWDLDGFLLNILQITTPAKLDPDLMLVGNTIGSAFVSGTYPNSPIGPVSEILVTYFVNDVVKASNYVLASGDVIGSATVRISDGTNNRDYFAEPSDILDYSFSTPDLEWIVPAGGGAPVPNAFADGQWSVTNPGTNGDINLNITGLPADNGSALTNIEYRIDSGTPVALGSTSTGTYGISGLTDGVSANFEIRALNANGNGPWSSIKSQTPTGVPAAFTSGQWTITDLGTGGDARINISALPNNSGASITDLQRKIGAGAWTSLGGTSTGNYDLNDLFTDGAATNVLIRAVNTHGNAPDSDTKSVTTSSGITIVSSGLLKNAGADANTWTSDTGVTVGTNQLLIVGVLPRKTSNSDTDNVVTAATYNGVGLDVELNARQTGSAKRGVIWLSNKTLLTTGTGANIVVNLSGSSVQFEAFQMYYWVLSGYNATTPLVGAEMFIDNTSTADTLVLTRTGAIANSMLLGMWAVDDGDEVVTVTDGTEDSNASTGSGSQDFKGVFAHKLVPTTGNTTMVATWSDRGSIGAILEILKA